MRSKHTNKRSRLSVAIGVAMMLVLATLGVLGGLALHASPAKAVIGRPFTPMSYAGVGRRSSRRVARRTAYRTTAYTSAAYATSVPAGCPMVNGVYSCGGSSYQPYYDGPNVVYMEE